MNALRSIVAVMALTAGSMTSAACLVDDTDFTSSGGGCQDLATELVWSPDLRALGAPELGNNSSADACDRFLNGLPAGGEFYDWRLPTVGEVEAALTKGLNAHLDFFLDNGVTQDDGQYRWTACRRKTRGAQWRYAVRYTDADVILEVSGDKQVICVRGAAADPDNDCPSRKGGGENRGNGKGKNAMLLPRATTGALLLLPLCMVATACLVKRRWV